MLFFLFVRGLSKLAIIANRLCLGMFFFLVGVIPLGKYTIFDAAPHYALQFRPKGK